MEQAADFLEECEVLDELVSSLPERQLTAPTGFKSWTAENIIRHLHFWNFMADLSLADPERSQIIFDRMPGIMDSGGLREFELQEFPQTGKDLLTLWRSFYREMTSRWGDVDPKARLPWAGPTMSARTSISARQMETWAHGQALFDMAGEDRSESDRLYNIVVLGVNAFSWNMKVQELDDHCKMPELSLVSPQGNDWHFEGKGGSVTGSAVSFCQLVTQTRNVADTDIETEGETASLWMANAQCFAGPKETPPAAGSRLKALEIDLSLN